MKMMVGERERKLAVRWEIYHPIGMTVNHANK
jgi:hypothetical protein